MKYKTVVRKCKTVAKVCCVIIGLLTLIGLFFQCLEIDKAKAAQKTVIKELDR